MENIILKAVLNYGVFPAVTIYLIFVIIKDFKTQLKIIASEQQEINKIIITNFSNINNSLSEIKKINLDTQNYINNYLNNLSIKLLDVLDDLDNN